MACPGCTTTLHQPQTAPLPLPLPLPFVPMCAAGNFMLLSGDERAPLKAIDFGLATPYDPAALPCTDLALEGTPWYMAPEVRGLWACTDIPGACAVCVWGGGALVHGATRARAVGVRLRVPAYIPIVCAPTCVRVARCGGGGRGAEGGVALVHGASGGRRASGCPVYLCCGVQRPQHAGATPRCCRVQVLRSEWQPASDIWAAGVMAFQLLSGRFPFDDKGSEYAPAITAVW